MSAIPRMPLSDAEIVELDNYLLSGDEASDQLTIDEAHGYVTALVLSGDPALAGPDWLEGILGRNATEQDQRSVALLRRMRQDIEQMLASGAPFEPLVAEVEEDGETFLAYEGWCFGFMLAVSNNEPRWEGLPKTTQELLQPIAALAMLNVDEDDDMDDEEYETLVELLPGSVRALHDWWRSNNQ